MLDLDFKALIGPAAKHLFWPEIPNDKFSTKTKLYFGNRGSIVIDLTKGVWFDHEANKGGTIIDLIIREKNWTKQQTIKYLFGIAKEHNIKARKRASFGGEISAAKNNLIRNTPIIPDFYNEKGNHFFGGNEVDKIYNYTNENGELIYQVLRYKPGSNMKFSQRRPSLDLKGYWIPNLDGITYVPYRLHKFANKDNGTIFICEGEKDVNNLLELISGPFFLPRNCAAQAALIPSNTGHNSNFYATCNPGGVGRWKEDYNKYFKNFNVIILPDNDDVGRKHAQNIYDNLLPIAENIQILNLPNLPSKGDVSDWIEMIKEKI